MSTVAVEFLAIALGAFAGFLVGAFIQSSMTMRAMLDNAEKGGVLQRREKAYRLSRIDDAGIAALRQVHPKVTVSEAEREVRAAADRR